jgi:hypothetical protein
VPEITMDLEESQMPELRDTVLFFAKAMEATLRKHDEAKGRYGWRSMTDAELDDLLKLALSKYDPSDGPQIVDIANILMMLWERTDKPRPQAEARMGSGLSRARQ